MKQKTYWIDVDINGKPHIGDWRATSKQKAIDLLKNYYKNKGIAERDIIIRNIK